LLLHDRDSKSSGGFNEILRSEGITIVRMPIRAPNATAYAERWVGTLRRECLDRIPIINRRQLEQVLRVYSAHSNRHRAAPITLASTARPTDLSARRRRYGTSRDTRRSAASSTNTQQEHEVATANDRVFEPHGHQAARVERFSRAFDPGRERLDFGARGEDLWRAGAFLHIAGSGGEVH
jgi:hypothetical protein